MYLAAHQGLDSVKAVLVLADDAATWDLPRMTGVQIGNLIRDAVATPSKYVRELGPDGRLDRTT